MRTWRLPGTHLGHKAHCTSPPRMGDSCEAGLLAVGPAAFFLTKQKLPCLNKAHCLACLRDRLPELQSPHAQQSSCRLWALCRAKQVAQHHWPSRLGHWLSMPSWQLTMLASMCEMLP